MKDKNIIIGVFWRSFRNIEDQKKIEENIDDDAYYEALVQCEAKKKMGFEAYMIQWKQNPIEVYNTILDKKIDLVFNASSDRELYFLETFNVPYTGTSINTVILDKSIRKTILIRHEINTPNFLTVRDKDNIPEIDLKYPLFIKLIGGRGSCGIDENNIIEEYRDIYKVVEKITEKIGQVALIEEFIEGREFSVGIIGYDKPQVLPILEIGYTFGKTNTYEHKMLDHEIIICPMEIPQDLEEEIKKISLKIYEILDIKDYGRLDFILDKNNVPYFLEVNTFPGLNMPSQVEKRAHYGYMGYMAEEKGYTQGEFLERIINSTRGRYDL